MSSSSTNLKTNLNTICQRLKLLCLLQIFLNLFLIIEDISLKKLLVFLSKKFKQKYYDTKDVVMLFHLTFFFDKFFISTLAFFTVYLVTSYITKVSFYLLKIFIKYHLYSNFFFNQCKKLILEFLLLILLSVLSYIYIYSYI